MLTRKYTPGRRSAFTLIEIMVAAAITIIMVGLVIQITSEVLKVWNRSVGKLAANAEARIAMELLTSDLETALMLNNGQQWLRVETAVDVGTPVTGQTVGLKLFAPALDRADEPGNICAVSYRLAYAPAYNNANADSFVLFRDLENPGETFTNLLGSGDPSPQLDLTGAGTFWDEAETVDPDNYLAGNIVDFKIFIYGLDDLGNQVILNSPGDDGEVSEDFIYGGNGSTNEDPLFAEIQLIVVTDEGLEILNLLNDNIEGTGFDGPEDVLRQHGEVFRRRVYFQAKAL